MRIRSTKPEFWRSERIASVSWEDRLVFKGLESYVDDNGVGKDDLPLIVADVFPRDLSRNPTGTLQKVSEALDRLSEAGLLWRYEADGTRFLFIAFWEQSQRIEKPTKGRFPRPDGTLNYRESEIRDYSGNPPGDLRPGTGEQGNRGTGEQGNRNPPNPPRGETSSKRGTRLEDDWIPSPELIDQMRSECPGVNLEAEHRIFVDYWIAQPGQKGVKVDWEATWRNWMRRKQGDTKTRPAPSRADEAQSFIQRLEAIDATRGSGEAAGNHQELR